MNAFFGPCSHSTIVKASGCATKSVVDRLQALLTETALRSVLCKGAGSDANGAFTNAKLFICLPHSCEVVKTRFFHALLETRTSKRAARWQLWQIRFIRDVRQGLVQDVRINRRSGVCAAATSGCTCLCGRLSVGGTEESIVAIDDTARPDQETSL